MFIRPVTNADEAALFRFWNERAPLQGFAPLRANQFSAIFFENKFFNHDFAFVAEQEHVLQGFVCGAADSRLPAGDVRGYFSCLLLAEGFDTAENANLLLSALENAFLKAGRSVSDVLFFNPIRLPWCIPNTNGHQHNNAPGVWVETPLHAWLLARGYAERARESAMYLNLADFSIPQKQLDKAARLSADHYEIAFYSAKRHTALFKMLTVLGNAEWQNEIMQCAKDGTPFLVAAQQGRVVGFAGPVYAEESGRGYFTGIGVVPAHEGHGLGSLLFCLLCDAEKKAGAEYMSLFTGETNPAKKIYEGFGFSTVRTFGLLRKTLLPAPVHL
ncbi:MAG: GNAT family N-acetyltransferase [Ruthenibacterium sp.]